MSAPIDRSGIELGSLVREDSNYRALASISPSPASRRSRLTAPARDQATSLSPTSAAAVPPVPPSAPLSAPLPRSPQKPNPKPESRLGRGLFDSVASDSPTPPVHQRVQESRMLPQNTAVRRVDLFGSVTSSTASDSPAPSGEIMETADVSLAPAPEEKIP